MKACWDEISEKIVRVSCSQVANKLRRVVKVKGGYIENVICTVFLSFLIIFPVKYFHLLLHNYRVSYICLHLVLSPCIIRHSKIHHKYSEIVCA